ncbi:MAG TPA: hypothetical protein DDY98_04805, partial [Ruminococcaceae bacterium]|nr:hypothetical protein [Oscillospiraceae bacterium]
MAVEVYEEECVSLPPQGADFKFEPSPLFHISLLHNNGKEYLYVQAHHIVADGESITVLLDDINKAYCGESLAAEAYSVFELSLDEQNARKGEGYGIAKRYYDSVFKGVSADYLRVFDRNEAPFADTIRYAVHVSPKEIETFCQKHHVTKNIFFTAVFALTLAKFTSHEEALFSTVYNGRTDPRTERLVGMLVKTLPVFVSAQPERLVSDFLKQTEEHIKQLRKYDIFSFADCAEEYGVNADTIFVYQGRMLAEARLGGQAVEQISVRNSQPKAELSAEVYEYDTSYDIRLEYNGGHYSPALMKSFADAYATCAACVLRSKTLGEIEITSQEALAEFEVFNDTFVDIPFMPVYRLFEKQVQATPERYAIIARKEADCSVYEKLTFRQLNGMANAVARQLCSLGISPGSPVALMTERTKEVAVAEYGILKAGCAFLFLSPSYPEERVAYIAGESGIKAIVTTHRLAEPRKELFEKLGLAVVFADDIDPNTDASDLNVAVSPDDLAYLIYTSGSTGKPKGVMVKQKGVVNLADNNGKNTHLIHYFSETSAAVAAFTFDASVVDTICSVVNGMTVCIASENEIHDPVAFTEMCLENQVKSICATPSFMLSLLEYPAFSKVLENAHAVICGGEAFPSSLYEKLRSANPNLNIINGYGPSETTVACTAKLLNNGEHITIGTPLNNYKIYIIDKQNHVLPMGALGELVILGVGVGKGYLNRDDLTEKSFITLLGEPAYKSGDLARITHTGEIEFHGRIDNQVKLRGLRIELGEIENAVNSCDGVITSIVTVNGNENNRFLAAYYTAERPIAAEEITAHISKSLAEYMVPRVFIQLDAMPLTANGKINKKELPTPVQESVEREYIAPTGETEKLLCEAFEKALGIAKVGVNDDFFELGGTSLTATKVAMFGMAHSIQIAY